MQVLYSLASADAALQQRTAAALARLVKDADLRLVFIERRGLDILMEPLKDRGTKEAQIEAAGKLLVPGIGSNSRPQSIRIHHMLQPLWMHRHQGQHLRSLDSFLWSLKG